MPADRVIVIRHAQKPTEHPKHDGVLEDGSKDPESLTVHGWQHAGALAAVFAKPGVHLARSGIVRPDVIFAAGARKESVVESGKAVEIGSHSLRPLQTVTPMAERLGLKPVTAYTKGQESDLVKDVLARQGTALVCWQHEDIPTIGNLITGNDRTVPQTWPADRYDLIWLFERRGDSWRFTQLPGWDNTD